MAHIKFENKKKKVSAQVIPVNESVVRIVTADKPVLTGFRLYLDADGKHPMDGGEYMAYTTLYRQGDGWYELSNDGSVYYQAPEEAVIADEPEEELSEEQLAEQERQARIAEISGQIIALKAQIEATDYQVIKNYEYTLVGLDPEYDILALHQERQGLRDQINQLQSELSEIQMESITENWHEPTAETWPGLETEIDQEPTEENCLEPETEIGQEESED